MTRDTVIQTIAGVVLLASLTVSGNLAVGISRSAAVNHLVYTDRAEEGAPPEVALGIAMGAFRGIFVNYLWIRANTLKEAGKFYEAVQLSDAITRLQPRFPRVWVFHAWNMAYNISVTTQTKEERWNWVRAGIDLLRDRGIPANPNDMILHKELAWFFQHKIGGFTDDANGYYKRKLAEEWTIVLGPPPQHDPKVRDRDSAIKQYIDWLTPTAEAPGVDELISSDPDVAELAARIRSDIGEELGYHTLRRYELARAAKKSLRSAQAAAHMGPKSAAMWKLVDDSHFQRAWQKLIPAVRRRVLLETYHMEAERMIRYTRKYGPLDWRVAASHAVYWSARGVENAQFRWTDKNKNDFDFINTDRVTIQSIQDLARYGDVYFDFLSFSNSGGGIYLAVPNTHFVQTYGDVLGELVARSWADSERRAYSFYAAGYENFLRDYIRFYWRRGQKDKAAELYHRLGTYPGQNMNDPNRAAELSRPLDEWVANEIADQLKVTYVALQEIFGALEGAYTTGLLAGDGDLFRSQFAYAQAFHKVYMTAQIKANPLDAGAPRMGVLPTDFRQCAAEVFWAILQTLDLDDSETVYANAPTDLQQAAYDMLRERFKKELDENPTPDGRKFDQIFGEPPGMKEFRQLRSRWEAADAEHNRPKAEQK